MKTDLHTAGTHRIPVETAAPAAVAEQGKALLERLGVAPASVDFEVPHRRLERWKYTPVQGILNAPLKRAVESSSAASFEPNPVPGLDAYVVVFENGFVDLSKSDLPVVEGVAVSFSESIESGRSDWFSALHASVASSGMTLTVEPGVVFDRPLLIRERFTGSDDASFVSHQVTVGANAQVELIHWVDSVEASSGFASGHWSLNLGENASLGMDCVQNDAAGLHRLTYTNVEQAASSRFRIHTATVSGDWVRNDLRIVLNGKGADAILHGAFLPTGAERVDNHTTVDHRAAHCTSSELYRGVLHDQSNGVFNGKVFVRPDAQLTNAYQQSNNILASDKATMNAKPELEIYADDVQCSHGCTIGQLDSDAMFYCRARGLDEVQARALLVQAFIADVVDGFASEEVRAELTHLYATRHGWATEE